jgi:processive 1,2-diacylglycerol beta-glucosyltransferase
MIRLLDAETGDVLGQITEEQLQFLVDQMEEEFMEDQDYAITPLTLTYFEGLNADPHLLGLLKQGLGARDEATIRWSRE